ncbi:MAG: 3-hydroxyacyl-ACP dehydratase FabZ [Rhodocyclaceae bacterium]|nr:3-hydroxyacyl-ACP dehydratase FabZ [Rhodocyclaceae bacterium]MCE2722151.1 3-hydroxyacyl-ACP dehydratase FabZ [Betaproteobacteria bacterium]MCA3002348.1 3-hydroxyacyl-ACP dehydratase FabZ [Rhodocyclaceae bacterium]MCA3018638.1 3-hydroxyacyl-ACP dehydratase FabZ [Rhodocyclaceae bacterium]MCA3022860.1 3-hydroxyacyl-ACP dehydratase FabZ [Rhodocyclaceae bacterium]
MDVEEIKTYLPHRYPFLLVDRVLELDLEHKKIRALKNVSVNEPHFPGHFSYYHVMPGVLIIEALAQASAILSFKLMGIKPDDKTVYYFAGIDGARFKRPITPGDTLMLESQVTGEKRGIYKFAVRALVGDQLACEADLLCTMRSVPQNPQ